LGGLGCAHSSRWREGAVDIEEADGVLDWALGERRDNARGGGSGGHDVGIPVRSRMCWCMFVSLEDVVLRRKLGPVRVLNRNVPDEIGGGIYLQRGLIYVSKSLLYKSGSSGFTNNTSPRSWIYPRVPHFQGRGPMYPTSSCSSLPAPAIGRLVEESPRFIRGGQLKKLGST